MAGLRYRYKDNALRVESDLPYYESYRLDYLALVRNTTSTIGASTDINSAKVSSGGSGGGSSSGGGGGGGGGGGSNTSSTNVNNTSQADFWGDLDKALGQMLTNTKSPEQLGQERARRLASQGPTPTTTLASNSNLPMTAIAAGAAAALGMPPIALPPPSSSVAAAPSAPGAADAQSATQGAAGEQKMVSINRQAGVISVYGTQAQQSKVAAYIKRIKETASNQVLIEAKVLQVDLNDKYNAGINWQAAFQAAAGKLALAIPFGKTVVTPFGSNGPFTLPGGRNPPTADRATVAVSNYDFGAVVNMVQEFGTVRTLSSPRLTAINNQPALLKVVTNKVFFTFATTDAVVLNGQVVTPSRTTASNETVALGMVMAVQPSINRETGEISMLVRPTLSKLIRNIPHPIFPDSTIPEIAVQEMETIVNMKSGQTMVMGGLMSDTTESTDTGTPGLAEIPLLGNLFKGRNDSSSKSEMVVFLKATIVTDASETVAPVDQDLYEEMGGDRRPLTFAPAVPSSVLPPRQGVDGSDSPQQGVGLAR